MHLTAHPDQTESDSKSGHGYGLYIALAPWILFTFINNHSSVKAASVIALVASIVIALPAVIAGRPKVLELGAVVTFVVFSIVAFVGDASTVHFMARYARGIAAGGLALIAFGSLLATPFTEQYARERVPRQYWGSPTFKAVNRRLTLMWGLVFTAMIPFHILAGVIDKPWANVVFNWVIPIYLIVWAAQRSQGPSDTDNDAH
jgi:hypothetical protein